jgi:NADH-quinone oxidoreductase subunit J
MPLWLFFFLAALAVLAALGVILQSNPVHCLLGLALNLLATGVIFIGLGAVTVGFLQIIIYVGAIMVLFLFVIWLLNLQAESFGGSLGVKFFGAIGAAALAAELATIFVHTVPISRTITAPGRYGSISTLGEALFSDYLIAFEVTSVLLLAAVVGAIGLARRIPSAAGQEERSEAEQTSLRGGYKIANRREQISTSLPPPPGGNGQGRERTSA